MKRLFFLLTFPVLMACQQPVQPNADGKVVKVADGDTFTLLDKNNKQIRVRLHGIDAPERGQDFGNVAREKLSELVFGKEVIIEKKDTDRYGRMIAIVYVNDTISVNERMLQEGLAWHYKEYDNNEAWAELEKQAKREKRGLWRQPKAIAPWQWRKEQRTETKKAA